MSYAIEKTNAVYDCLRFSGHVIIIYLKLEQNDFFEAVIYHLSIKKRPDERHKVLKSP